jgi:hypothetical protein
VDLRPNHSQTVGLGVEAYPETRATGFEVKPKKTVATGFEVKPKKTVQVVLKPNHSQTVGLGFEV